MSEPFFDYIQHNRKTVSNNLYGYEDAEKVYGRVTYQKLPEVSAPDIKLADVLLKRQSTLRFGEENLTLVQLSQLLRYSLARNEQSQGVKKYPFPSGGGFYPIETYLLANKVSGLEPGVYHYKTVTHEIAKINGHSLNLEEVNNNYGCSFETLPHVVLHMTMVKSRTIHKYGSLCYILSLLEAGHRGQNLCLCAAACDVGVRPMGGGKYEKINAMLDIDGMNEHHIYGLAIGTAPQA